MKDAPRISFCRNKYPQTSVNPSATVPFPVDATFVISVNLLHGRRASARLTCFLLYFVPANIFHRDNVPHNSLFRMREVCESVSSIDRWYVDKKQRCRLGRRSQRLFSVPAWAGLGTVRSAIVLRKSNVVASACRAVTRGFPGLNSVK